MTYSQLLLRVAATAIILGAIYLLVSSQLCLPTRSGSCRPVHGAAALVLFSAFSNCESHCQR
jgi:hypothetical protein